MMTCGREVQEVGLLDQGNSDAPPLPLPLIQRGRYFCLFLISCTAGGLQRDRLHYFKRWGRFSGTGKVKKNTKKQQLLPTELI